MFFLYNALLVLLCPFWIPWMLWRTWKRNEQPNWQERFGNYQIPKKKGPRLWLHAVSVGEVMAAAPILRAFKKLKPRAEVILSVTTSSGHTTAEQKLAGLYEHLVYFPIDIPRYQLLAMTRVKPSVVAIMETELWMNFLWAADVVDAKSFVLNGRVSDRSFPRSMKLRGYYRMLFKFMTEVLAQSEVDAERFRALGMERVSVYGNCKFDEALAESAKSAAEWRNELKIADGDFVVVVGSTRSELEEELVLKALQSLNKDGLKVIHAPRHIERAEQLRAAAAAVGFNVGQRSKCEDAPYLILDTYGELAGVYNVADVAVVGGGFDTLGGQNLVQPMALGVPVLHGHHMDNFRDITELARRAGATQTCATADELAAALQNLRADEAMRKEMGDAGKELVRMNSGASEKYAQRLADAFSE
ncbi:MAG: 3-deoxy-D-manno-octulosonic acid transferase [Armatimonadetes bacterium]|nr:3-deoxy-D-manno-octulosonic acid transferase [Armatimonadota bacterium]